MKVQAKCIISAWDNPVLYQPGRGPLEGGLYEIEHDGQLAGMKSNGRWVFEFDREAAKKAASVIPESVKAEWKFKCRKCAEPFPTVEALASHVRTSGHTKESMEREAVENESIHPGNPSLTDKIKGLASSVFGESNA